MLKITPFIDIFLVLDMKILEIKNFWRLKEVRSKISIPLETTGGTSISLEGFEKSLFLIWNFTHGDLQSTGDIQISF